MAANPEANTMYYATDESDSGWKRVEEGASAAESKILLKAFDVGDPMELGNTSTNCKIPKMAAGLWWMGQCVLAERCALNEEKSGSLGLMFRFIFCTYRKSRQAWETNAQSDEEIAAAYQKFLRDNTRSINPIGSLWQNFFACIVLLGVVPDAAATQFTTGHSASQPSQPSMSQRSQQSQPTPAATAAVSYTDMLAMADEDDDSDDVAVVINKPNGKRRKRFEPLPSPQGLGLTEDVAAIPPEIKRFAEAEERWEAEMQLVQPACADTHRELVEWVNYFEAAAAWASEDHTSQLKRFVAATCIKAGKQVIAVANGQGMLDDAATIMLTAMDRYGDDAFTNYSARSRAGLRTVRTEQEYDGSAYSFDQSTQKMVPRVSLASSKLAGTTIANSVVCAIEIFLGTFDEWKHEELVEAIDFFGPPVGTDLLKIEKALQSDHGDQPAAAHAGVVGDQTAADQPAAAPLAAKLKTTILGMLARPGFFVTFKESPGDAPTFAEAGKHLAKFGLGMFVQYEPYKLKAKGTPFLGAGWAEKISGNNLTAIFIKVPEGLHSDAIISSRKVAAGLSTTTEIKAPSDAFDLSASGTNSKNTRAKASKTLQILVSAVVGVHKKESILSRKVGEEASELLELALSAYEFADEAKVLREETGGEPESEEKAAARVFFSANSTKAEKMHQYVWNAFFDASCSSSYEQSQLMLAAAAGADGAAAGSDAGAAAGALAAIPHPLKRVEGLQM